MTETNTMRRPPRLANANRYNQYAIDRWEYQVGLESQRLGIPYVHSLNDDERAAVDRLSFHEARRLTLPHGRYAVERKRFARRGGLTVRQLPALKPDRWDDEKAEVYGSALAALLFLCGLTVLGLLIAPFLLCVWAAPKAVPPSGPAKPRNNPPELVAGGIQELPATPATREGVGLRGKRGI